MTAQTDGFPASRWRRVWAVIDERLGLSGLAYPVPAHANGIGYILGGITFFGFLILAATGVWLAQFYHPTPEAARESVQYITLVAPLGDIARGIHFWTANVVMATVLLHMGRVYLTGAYKRPREVNWLIGLGLLTVTIGLIFTGTVLKWDQEGFEALGHNVEIGDFLGTIGFWFSPTFTTSLPVVGRLYIAHVVILPALGTMLLIAHFLLVKRHGISARPADFDAAVDGGPQPSKEGSTFAIHLIRMVGFGLVIVAVAGVLSIVVQTPLGMAPDPSVEISKPWWMFLPFYPFEDWFGLPALIWVPGILISALALVPFIDRSRYRSPARRLRYIVAGGLVTIALVALTALAALEPVKSHVGE
ncbi:MAG TPA: cytochrome b N-terminal domain-containing protein [Candidatus Limnocylindrales bacterium]